MATAPAPGQMFSNMLDAKKGWPSPVALDYTVKISPNVLYNAVPGQVGHLNSVGQWEPGVVGKQMGLFLFQGVTDLDVNSTGGTAGGVTQWIPISPTGKAMALVAKGPYELETTEFDSTLTYAIGDPLRSPTGNGATNYTDGTNSGKLVNSGFTFGTNAYCGVTSAGVLTNSYGVKVIRFWPVYQPTATS